MCMLINIYELRNYVSLLYFFFACSSEPISGFLDDYAFLIKGLLDYYVSTMDESILYWAKSLQDTQDSLFWDTKHGGYFYSRENSPNVVIRLKEGNIIACKK